MPDAIPSRFRNLRRKQKISKQEAAFNAHISASHLGQIERGEKNVTIETLEKISHSLQKPLKALVEVGETEEDKDTTLSLLLSLEGEFQRLSSREQARAARIFRLIISLALDKDGKEKA